MLCETLVQKSVIAINHLNQRTVFADNVIKEFLGLAPHGLPEIIVKLGTQSAKGFQKLRANFGKLLLLRIIQAFRRALPQLTESCPHFVHDRISLLLAGKDGSRIDLNGINIPGLQPLAREILDQRIRAPVGHHPFDLCAEVLPQFAGIGESSQLIVRHGRPKEVGQS